MLKKRIDDYNTKQKEIEERQKENDILLQRQMKEKHNLLCEKEKNRIETRMRNEASIEENRKKVLEKINSVEDKIRKQKENNYYLSIEKMMETSMKKEDIEENIIRREKALEYYRLQKIEELKEKDKRVEEMKIQKAELAEEKRKLNLELQRSKEKMLKKFEMIKKNSKFQSKDELFNELFEENNLNTYSYLTANDNHNKNHNSAKNVNRSCNDDNNYRGVDYNKELTPEERIRLMQQNDNKGDLLFITNAKKKDSTLEEIVSE